MRAMAAAIAGAAAVASVLLLSPRPSQQPAPAPVKVEAAQPAPTPPPAPRTFRVTIAAEPAGAEIYEGARLIGRAPKIWVDAAEGDHDLTLRHEGYHEERGRILVAHDGDEFQFRLRKVEAEARKTKRNLKIKAER
jgi:hypothetical protein